MNQCVILRAVIPNKKSWVFRWICEVVIPNCLGYQFCKKLIVVTTGGDQRQMYAINECLKNIFLNAERLRLAWHIVDCGWERNVRCMIGCTKKSTKHNGIE